MIKIKNKLAILCCTTAIAISTAYGAAGSSDDFASDIRIQIGHGGIESPLSTARIEGIRARHQHNPVLKQAFGIVEGADRAIAHDFNLLLKEIRHQHHVNGIRIDGDELLDNMRRERDLVTQAAYAAGFSGSYETTFLPFVDQLHALGDQGAIYGGYKGRHGIDRAIGLIKNNRELIRGVIPAHLRNVSGRESIELRIALYYIAKAKGSDVRLKDLKSFYQGDYFGSSGTRSKVKSILQQTSFYEDGFFFAPDNGYIKNSDQTNTVGGKKGMTFADCSGFAQHVARHFHPHNSFLQDNRIMSYQLAPLYDSLMNDRFGTSQGLYVNGERKRDLSSSELRAMRIHSDTIDALSRVYEPIFYSKNIKPGDILVQRHYDGSEGHVMIVAEKDGDKLTILELTGFGKNRGYKWRTEWLSDSTYDSFHRVLRIKGAN